MQLESKKRLTIRERTYRALGEIAKSTRKAEVDEEIVTDAVLNWTIDPISRNEDGELEAGDEVSEDLTTLFSYVVHHLNGQRQVEDAMSVAKQMADRMKELDTAKLSAQDPEEWDKLTRIMDDETGPKFEIPDTLDDFLEEAGADSPVERTGDQVVKDALVHRVDSQAKASQLLAFFLENVYEGNNDVVHGVIAQYDCVLVHIICSLLLSWVESRTVLPEHMSLPDWFNDLREMGLRAESMTDEEKIELGTHYLDFGEDED
jgi:hypothetical protein